ncbi:MAG: CDP-diacylglycerol--glycerol-3-phosphate 3-phosphatidyltransferase [Actinomycetota bacterium]
MSGPAPRHDPFGFGWPNVVSVVRIALIPVVALLIAHDTPQTRWIATGIFIVGAASDFLDGYLARRHGMQTATGAWLDPLSDKLFVAVPAIVLSIGGEFPWWATAVIIARELAVTWLRWRLDQEGGTSMPASKVGKIKTVMQLLAIGFSIAPLATRWDPLVLGLTGVAVVLTVYSGVEYFLTTRHRVRAS